MRFYALVVLCWLLWMPSCARPLPDMTGFPCDADKDCGSVKTCVRGVCSASQGEKTPSDGGVVEEEPCFEGETRGCFSGPSGASSLGTCSAGTQTCTQGSWGACIGEILPATETCDEKDNNCDGQIDNGEGLCPAGEACTDGKCEACKQPANQECNKNPAGKCRSSASCPKCICGASCRCLQQDAAGECVIQTCQAQ